MQAEGVPDPSGEVVDQATFSQILEMDEDEDEREFSKSIVYDFFEQARSTFDKMEKALYVISSRTLRLWSFTQSAR